MGTTIGDEQLLTSSGWIPATDDDEQLFVVVRSAPSGDLRKTIADHVEFSQGWIRFRIAEPKHPEFGELAFYPAHSVLAVVESGV